MLNRRSFLKLSSASLLALGLPLSGCGSGSASGSGSAGGAGGNAIEKTSDGLSKVTFVSPTALESFDYLGIYAGIKMGYFAEEGIELKLVEQTGTDDAKMISSGTAQFGYPSPGVMWSCIDAGVTNLKAITNYDIIQIFGIATNKDAGIESFDDLKGKDIALAVESWSALISPILDKSGLSTSDVNMVVYGDGRYEAVRSGKAPALATWLSEYSQLVGQGYDLGYLNGNDVAPQVSNSLVTSTDFIESNPDIVQGMVNAFTKALYFCYCNPEAAADITLSSCPNLSIDWNGALGAAQGDIQQFFGMEAADQQAYIDNGIGTFDMEMAQNAADNLFDSQTISQQYKAEDYYTNDFADKVNLDQAAVQADAQAYQFESQQYADAH